MSRRRASDTLAEAGVPHPIADAVADVFAAFNAGLITPQRDRSLLGTTPIDEVITQLMRGSRWVSRREPRRKQGANLRLTGRRGGSILRRPSTSSEMQWRNGWTLLR